MEQRTQILEKLKAIMRKCCLIADGAMDEVVMEANLRNDLGFSSLEEIEFFMECENEFQITIPDNEAEKIKTVEDWINVIQKYVGAA